MSFLRLSLGIPVLLLVSTACIGGDSDGDGLSNSEEEELGLDPEVADSDADGLSDGEEVELGYDPLAADGDADGLNDAAEKAAGSDPANPDTDADTYQDGWEVIEETDPTDADDRIYEGYWPYNPNKADLKGEFSGSPLANGDFVGDHVGRDQFGEKVHLFDFLGQGKDVIIDASAQWCGPCQVTALWIATHGEEDLYGYEPVYGELRQAIDDGDVLWFTVIVENNNGGDATAATVEQWDSDFPHESIPVLTDDDNNMMDGVIMATGFFPSGVLLNEDGKVLEIGGMDTVMSQAQNRL